MGSRICDQKNQSHHHLSVWMAPDAADMVLRGLAASPNSGVNDSLVLPCPWAGHGALTQSCWSSALMAGNSLWHLPLPTPGSCTSVTENCLEMHRLLWGDISRVTPHCDKHSSGSTKHTDKTFCHFMCSSCCNMRLENEISLMPVCSSLNIQEVK